MQDGYLSQMAKTKYVYRICWGKPVKGGQLDNRIDGITHDIME